MDVQIYPVQTFAAGSRAIPETAIGDAITFIQLAVNFCTSADPTIWPNPAHTITFNIEMSVGGGPFQPWNSPAIGSGGIHSVKGSELPLMYVGGTLPPGVNRKLRGSIVLSASIKTGAVLTVL